MMCAKCSKASALFFLVLGVLFLLVDFGTWDFWGIQWWTALFLVLGITGFCKSSCPSCQACMSMGKKK